MSKMVTGTIIDGSDLLMFWTVPRKKFLASAGTGPKVTVEFSYARKKNGEDKRRTIEFMMS